jgi:hypothetical protein
MATLNEQVEQALQVMLTTTDAAQRRQVNDWLQQLQSSTAAWTTGLELAEDVQRSLRARTLGATILCNKLRGGGGGGLAPADAASLRARCLGVVRSLEVVDADARALRSQLCRAVPLLLAEHAQAGSAVVSETAQAALPVDATLEIMRLLPDSGVFLQPAEISSVQDLMLQLLEHACEPSSSPFPPALGAAGAPSVSSSAYRAAVLETACAWAALPSDEGLTLGLFAEARSFRLISEPSAWPDASPAECRLRYELVAAALDNEPTEHAPPHDGLVPLSYAHAAAYGTPPSGKPKPVGLRAPHVPRNALLVVIDALGQVLRPIAAAAPRPRADGQPDGVYAEDDVLPLASRTRLSLCPPAVPWRGFCDSRCSDRERMYASCLLQADSADGAPDENEKAAVGTRRTHPNRALESPPVVCSESFDVCVPPVPQRSSPWAAGCCARARRSSLLQRARPPPPPRTYPPAPPRSPTPRCRMRCFSFSSCSCLATATRRARCASRCCTPTASRPSSAPLTIGRVRPRCAPRCSPPSPTRCARAQPSPPTR